MKWRFFLAEAINSIRGNAATTLAAVVTVLIVTFLLGVTVTVGKWVYDYTNGVRNDITVKAYVSTSDYGSNDPQTVVKRGDLLNEIKQLPYVKTVTYVSPAAALKTVSPSMRESAKEIGYNPFPPSFWLKLTDPAKASLVAAEVGRVAPVHACDAPPCVTYGSQITKRVLNTTKYILYFLTALMILLAVAAVVLIQNTIRLSIFARRREIEVMKLVGATNSFVRLPFMLEGMITGRVGVGRGAGAALDRVRRAQQHPGGADRPGAVGRGVHPDAAAGRLRSRPGGVQLGADAAPVPARLRAR